MIRRLRRPVAATLIVAILLTNVPVPSAAGEVATVQAIDPLQVANAMRPSATTATSSVVRPINSGRVPQLPPSYLVAPHVTALAFHPFDVVDPSTGKPVSPSSTIYLPHEHRSVNAGKYYKDVNLLEQSMNKMGYTLRSKAAPTLCTSVTASCTSAALYARLAGSQQAEMLTTVHYVPANPGHPFLQPNVINQLSRLDAMVSPATLSQEDQFLAATKEIQAIPATGPSPKPPPTLVAMVPATCAGCKIAVGPSPKPHKCVGPAWFPNSWYSSYWYWATLVPDGIKDKSVKLPHLCHMPKKAELHDGLVSAAKPWSTSLGAKSTAEFTLGSSLNIGGDATKKGIDIEASASAGAYLLGQGPYSVASAKASAKGKQGSIDVEILGKTVWNPHGSLKFKGNQTFNQTFFQFQIPISFLWFQVTLEASAQGSFGFQYGMSLALHSSGFFVEPFVSVSATFSANIGIGIVILSINVGVYGTVTIAKFGLEFSATGTTWVPAEYSGKRKKTSNIIGCKLYFQYQLGLDDKFTALSGQMGIQAQLCVDLFFWSNCWTAQLPLFSWTGITASDNIFKIPSTPEWKQIGPWYTDRPEYGYHLQKGMAFSPDDKSGEPAACHALGAK